MSQNSLHLHYDTYFKIYFVVLRDRKLKYYVPYVGMQQYIEYRDITIKKSLVPAPDCDNTYQDITWLTMVFYHFYFKKRLQVTLHCFCFAVCTNIIQALIAKDSYDFT